MKDVELKLLKAIELINECLTVLNTDSKNKEATIIATDETIYMIVRKEIKRLGKNADLNHIDTSRVFSNMVEIFAHTSFNGNIDNWNVSNVTNMKGMLRGATSLKVKPVWYKE